MGDLDLRTSVGAAPLQRDAVLVDGPEAAVYLQGQLSQDVAGLALGASAATLLLQPTGKVDAWGRLTRTGDEAFALDVDSGWGEAAASRLRRFMLRTNAEVHTASWSGFAVRGPGAAGVTSSSGLVLSAGWPGIEGVDLLGEGAGPPLPNTIPVVAPEVMEALRITCGVPTMGAELTEATIPAEAGQWLIDASVSFTKGCYTGQELVARIDSRGGNVPRPLRGLLVDGEPVPAGAEVVLGDAAVGAVTSSAVSPHFGAVALAAVARAVPVETSVVVRWPGGEGTATVVELPLR